MIGLGVTAIAASLAGRRRSEPTGPRAVSFPREARLRGTVKTTTGTGRSFEQPVLDRHGREQARAAPAPIPSP